MLKFLYELRLKACAQTYCTCTHDLVLSTFWSTTLTGFPVSRVIVRPSSTRTIPSFAMFSALQTYLLHTIGGQGTLAESFRSYAKPSLVFICCGAEPQWADSHKLAVKGKVYFFEGGLLDLIWSLPGIFAAAALLHYDMASTRQPPKQHCPLQNITSAISVWIHSGGLCLSVRWTARVGKEA